MFRSLIRPVVRVCAYVLEPRITQIDTVSNRQIYEVQLPLLTHWMVCAVMNDRNRFHYPREKAKAPVLHNIAGLIAVQSVLVRVWPNRPIQKMELDFKGALYLGKRFRVICSGKEVEGGILLAVEVFRLRKTSVFSKSPTWRGNAFLAKEISL